MFSLNEFFPLSITETSIAFVPATPDIEGTTDQDEVDTNVFLKQFLLKSVFLSFLLGLSKSRA